MRLPTAVAIALLAFGAGSAGAQAGREDPFARLRTDSTAWQRVLDFTIARLGPLLVRASADTSSQAWLIRLPEREPQKHLIERQLRTILRARPAEPTDSVFHTIEFGPLTIAADTARVTVTVNETVRCPHSSRTTSSGTVDNVVVPRTPQSRTWGAARSPSTIVGDNATC